MEDNNIKLGIGQETTSEKPQFIQRRSSMKQGGGAKIANKTSLKRKISFVAEVEEEEEKVPDKKYRNSKTFYSDSSVNKKNKILT